MPRDLLGPHCPCIRLRRQAHSTRSVGWLSFTEEVVPPFARYAGIPSGVNCASDHHSVFHQTGQKLVDSLQFAACCPSTMPDLKHRPAPGNCSPWIPRIRRWPGLSQPPAPVHPVAPAPKASRSNRLRPDARWTRNESQSPRYLQPLVSAPLTDGIQAPTDSMAQMVKPSMAPSGSPAVSEVSRSHFQQCQPANALPYLLHSSHPLILTFPLT